ncbi:MAG TPA: TolC family protein, partial [Pyrinomonadaceae bacterium]|nr:TolC family protein [Pyrinomonadaceae bacterium]
MSRRYSFAAASRRIAFFLAAFSLAANFALAGTTKALASGRSGGQKSKAAPARAKKVKPAAAEPTLVSENAAPQPSQRPAAANAFKTVGEPFLALTAQTQTQQQQTPAQRDATRPPGTEQRQTVPPDARPRPSDPTAPPGTERQQSPRTPPGTTAPSQTQDRRTPVPAPTQDPTAPPVSTDPLETPTPEAPADQQLPEPDFPAVQPRPVPPLPSLARVGVNRDDTLPLTLNEAIRRALENNNTIEVARNDVRLAESTLLGLRGVYDPSIVYRSEINNSIRPVPNIFGGAGSTGTVSTTDYNNDFSVQKQFGKGGGNYTYFFNNTRENTDATNTTLNPFYSSNQGITFTQPLWRNRSIDRNRQQIRIQQKRLQQSDADFRRSTIDVISQVQRAYWDLVFALRDEQNQIANLNLARENFRRTEASVAAGASAPLERAEIQTELSTREQALLIASQSVTVAENNLKNLMLKDPLNPEWSRALLPTDQPSFDDTPISLDASLKEARANRPEMRRLQLQQEISDIDIQFFKNQTKPQVDLTGTFSTTGLAGTQNVFAGSTDPRQLIDPTDTTDPAAFLLAQVN